MSWATNGEEGVKNAGNTPTSSDDKVVVEEQPTMLSKSKLRLNYSFGAATPADTAVIPSLAAPFICLGSSFGLYPPLLYSRSKYLHLFFENVHD